MALCTCLAGGCACLWGKLPPDAVRAGTDATCGFPPNAALDAGAHCCAITILSSCAVHTICPLLAWSDLPCNAFQALRGRSVGIVPSRALVTVVCFSQAEVPSIASCACGGRILAEMPRRACAAFALAYHCIETLCAHLAFRSTKDPDAVSSPTEGAYGAACARAAPRGALEAHCSLDWICV